MKLTFLRDALRKRQGKGVTRITFPYKYLSPPPTLFAPLPIRSLSSLFRKIALNKDPEGQVKMISDLMNHVNG